MGSFRVIGDEDARGLRLWDKTRTTMIAQHFFDDLNPKDLDIRVEAAPEGGLLVQATHPANPKIFGNRSGPRPYPGYGPDRSDEPSQVVMSDGLRKPCSRAMLTLRR